MKKIIFVCTGNTCRSPMAEYIARKLFTEKGIDAVVESRGLTSYGAGNANELAVKVVFKGEEIDEIKDHKVKRLTLEDINTADLILTMTNEHASIIRDLYAGMSSSANKVFALNEYVNVQPLDICDPFGGSEETYKNCMNEIKSSLELLACKLKG